ncbi:MAG TPA: hypothetical protein VG104_13060, partial [Candidatus Dormibacteraeota bacterium]|nr:hypothetical protein [Candidatus Dormibacteraeota bacterium]
MSRRLKRQLGKAPGGRGIEPSPRPRAVARTPLQRLNRILLIGGAGLAVGAVMLALVSRPFQPMVLGINLAAIGLGLLMGKGIG